MPATRSTATGSAWAIEAVDGSGEVGQYSSLALDASDNPGATIKEKSLANLVVAVMDLARAIGLPLTMSMTLFFKALMAVDSSVRDHPKACSSWVKKRPYAKNPPIITPWMTNALATVR